MTTLIQDFIQATNAFDVEAALALFAADAVIADASVGDAFAGRARIRDYLEAYFVRYHTVTTLIAVELVDDRQAAARVAFAGDFGHETGVLKLRIDADGRIARIDADLD
ncbi:nuclear transport factor 2 family protein [Siculibacillus lacustris]|uniref:Nuclear transport factor 2 family protein n=1 Tax=Siculibacillus lacustris TaxID=1549641 RepID=A0A4Q9VXU0_9HYPH|nr:nuclear transport factor 2 family protein [Siculibacillus lacustris]TBW41326.1 nuclear transport factor 2 family protein [Siculibacillus lacustris]